MRERPLCFDCDGDTLVGVLAEPDAAGDTGVVVVVGGPQYRAGSHRQFTLLARALANAGIACLRFDLRGMGDSEGPRRGFEHATSDIAAAVNTLVTEAPGVRRVVLWGLCDGAAACAFYAATDPRVAGVALVNPWVRTESGAAQATLRQYYRGRLTDRAFWRKLVRGEVDVRAGLRDAIATLRRALSPARPPAANAAAAPLPGRVGAGLAAFGGAMLVALSGRDTVAEEFRAAAVREPALAAAMARAAVTWREMPEADHTFSSSPWQNAMEEETVAWLRATRTRGAGASPRDGRTPG